MITWVLWNLQSIKWFNISIRVCVHCCAVKEDWRLKKNLAHMNNNNNLYITTALFDYLKNASQPFFSQLLTRSPQVGQFFCLVGILSRQTSWIDSISLLFLSPRLVAPTHSTFSPFFEVSVNRTSFFFQFSCSLQVEICIKASYSREVLPWNHRKSNEETALRAYLSNSVSSRITTLIMVQLTFLRVNFKFLV